MHETKCKSEFTTGVKMAVEAACIRVGGDSNAAVQLWVCSRHHWVRLANGGHDAIALLQPRACVSAVVVVHLRHRACRMGG